MTICKNRKEARKYLASLIETAMVGEGKPVQAVFPYQAGDFGGQSPVVTVTSEGSSYDPLAFHNSVPTHWLNIHTFILYSSGEEWTEADCEDALDDVELALNELIQDNNKATDVWNTIAVDERSKAGSVLIGGVEYRTNVITVRVG
jgi:hypothetical protein